MRSSFFSQTQESQHPDALYQKAYHEKSRNKAEAISLLQMLTDLPHTKWSIIPQIKGFFLLAEIDENKDKQISYLMAIDKLIMKHVEWINKEEYFSLIQNFLQKLYNQNDPFCQQLFVIYLKENLKDIESIKNLDNLSLLSYSSIKSVNFRILLGRSMSIWDELFWLPPSLVATMVLILYDARTINALLAYIGQELNKDKDTHASKALSFFEKFNLDYIAKFIPHNTNFETIIELLYQLVEKGALSAEYFSDFAERIFQARQSEGFDSQLATCLADKLYYYQAKCLLSGINREQAIEKLQAISSYNVKLYSETCYELGSFYAVLYNASDDKANEEAYGLAKEYLLKAKELGHSASNSIDEILNNMVQSSSISIKNNMN